MALMFAASPRSRTFLVLSRRATRDPSSEVAIAVTTWGRNIAPYCVPLRSYSEGSVKMVLAAGKVTSVIPWTSPARLTARISTVEAMGGSVVRPVSRAGRGCGRRPAGRSRWR